MLASRMHTPGGPMADDSLLDQLLEDHVTREREAPRRRAAASAMARSLDEARRASAVERRREELKAAETRARARSQAPELAGFREGQRFEVKGNRPELQGVWTVVRVERGAAGDASRRLFAQRGNGQGYLPLTEKQLQDLLYARIIVRLD